MPFKGGDYHMIAHGDRVHYAVTEVGTWETKSAFADGDKLRPLSANGLTTGDPGWRDYAVCALASSALKSMTSRPNAASCAMRSL